MTYLLDANVLIALTVAEHEHHARATSWIMGVDSFAVCPIVEGALVRYLLRLGESSATAFEVVVRVRAIPGCVFWPDSISYAEVALEHVRGHRQVTDAYLVGLARAQGGSLATLDEGLAGSTAAGAFLLPGS